MVEIVGNYLFKVWPTLPQFATRESILICLENIYNCLFYNTLNYFKTDIKLIAFLFCLRLLTNDVSHFCLYGKLYKMMAAISNQFGFGERKFDSGKGS